MRLPGVTAPNLHSERLRDATMFERITSDPEVLGGKPRIRHTRISVEMILEWLASGASATTIVAEYPHLEVEDVQQAIRYASRFLENEILIPEKAR
jgi:uncharacterized protein (DUF433 family)